MIDPELKIPERVIHYAQLVGRAIRWGLFLFCLWIVVYEFHRDPGKALVAAILAGEVFYLIR